MSGPLWQMTLAYSARFYIHTNPVSATRAPMAARLRPTNAGGDAQANRESDGRPPNCAESCHFSSFTLQIRGKGLHRARLRRLCGQPALRFETGNSASSKRRKHRNRVGSNSEGPVRVRFLHFCDLALVAFM